MPVTSLSSIRDGQFGRQSTLFAGLTHKEAQIGRSRVLLRLPPRVQTPEIVANADILQTVADQTQVIRQLVEKGYAVRSGGLERLSPYSTQHLRRFGV